MQASDRKMVLVVDDEHMLRFLYVEMLKKIGYQGLIAADHDEAISLFRANRSDILCVVMDVSLAGIDGLETMKSLQEIDPDIRVILSSGHDKHDLQNRFENLDAVEYLQKPYNIRQLKQAIDNPAVMQESQDLSSASLKVV
jgi:DNA-binding NtrC family response regulator